MWPPFLQGRSLCRRAGGMPVCGPETGGFGIADSTGPAGLDVFAMWIGNYVILRTGGGKTAGERGGDGQDGTRGAAGAGFQGAV